MIYNNEKKYIEYMYKTIITAQSHHKKRHLIVTLVKGNIKIKHFFFNLRKTKIELFVRNVRKIRNYS